MWDHVHSTCDITATVYMTRHLLCLWHHSQYIWHLTWCMNDNTTTVFDVMAPTMFMTSYPLYMMSHTLCVWQHKLYIWLETHPIWVTKHRILTSWPQATIFMTSHPLYFSSYPLPHYVWYHVNFIWHHIHSLWYHTTLWHHIHCTLLVCLMLEKGMANHFGILALRIPWTVWKAKRYDTVRWTPKVSRCLICYWRNNSRKNEEIAPMQKQRPVLGVTGGGSKVWCDKKQYCIGTWNVRSMNQGKLKVVKQEMSRVDIDILGIERLLLND